MTIGISPATPAAEVLSTAWQAALGTAPSGPGADFFAGGDSLLAVRMVSRIRKADRRLGVIGFACRIRTRRLGDDQSGDARGSQSRVAP